MDRSVSITFACTAPSCVSLFFHSTLCRFANVTLQNPCEIENTAYIAYEVGGEYINIVSRGNCATGLYCDSIQRVCLNEKVLGATCDGDKECVAHLSVLSHPTSGIQVPVMELS
jgi:hypothetical protein